MKKKLISFLLALFMAIPAYSQERANAAAATDASIVHAKPPGVAATATAKDAPSASVKRHGKPVKAHVRMEKAEWAEAHGVYVVECIGLCGGTGGWKDEIHNVVTTVGKNLALDTFLAGSAYTVVGPFVGLISSVSFAAGPVVGDTMTSHAGWTEAGVTNAPTYTIPRKTPSWSAASAGSKATSAAMSYAITGAGTVKGCFLVYGTGALSTVDNTGGVLYSTGLFTGGDKVVSNGDTLNVTYTASM